MQKQVRSVLIFVGIVQALFAIAFFFQMPFATGLWPFDGTTPLTFIFIASIFAAAAASTLWATLTGNLGALAGIGLDYLTILTPVAILVFRISAQTGKAGMVAYGIACAIGALFGLALFLWSARIPLDDRVPTPRFVRGSFIVFIIALLLVGGRLVFRVPNSIPWTITPDLSVVIGWMFLGAATYFAYGLLRPSWSNAAGQLVGFLAYDLVLIVPFLTRLPDTAQEFRLGLWIYTFVIAASGLIAIFFLFIHPPTRLWPKPRPGAVSG